MGPGVGDGSRQIRGAAGASGLNQRGGRRWNTSGLVSGPFAWVFAAELPQLSHPPQPPEA